MASDRETRRAGQIQGGGEGTALLPPAGDDPLDVVTDKFREVFSVPDDNEDCCPLFACCFGFSCCGGEDQAERNRQAQHAARFDAWANSAAASVAIDAVPPTTTLKIPTDPVYGQSGCATVAKTSGAELICVFCLNKLLTAPLPQEITLPILAAWSTLGSEEHIERLSGASADVDRALTAMKNFRSLDKLPAETMTQMFLTLPIEADSTDPVLTNIFTVLHQFHNQNNHCSIGAILRHPVYKRAFAIALMAYPEVSRIVFAFFDPYGFSDTQTDQPRPLILFSEEASGLYPQIRTVLQKLSVNDKMTWHLAYLKLRNTRVARDEMEAKGGAGPNTTRKKSRSRGGSTAGSQFAASASSAGDGGDLASLE